MVQGEIPNPDGSLTTREDLENPPSEKIVPNKKFIEEVKNDAKARVTSDENFNIFNHVKNLIKQGNIIELMHVEQVEATWQSYIFNLPKGTMKFLINCSIDTLPSKANLKQWGKRTNALCSLHCGLKETTNHILNCCKVSLPRFTYRHNNILSYILKCLDTQRFKVYSDIDGFQTSNGGTIPPNILVTTLRPDVVIIDEKKKAIYIFELTVPGELRIKEAHKLKHSKYEHFERDITSYKVKVIPFEIGSHTGLVTNDNRKYLHELHSFCKSDIKLKKFIQNISVIAVLGSFYIFNARHDLNWSEDYPIPAPFPNQ